MEIQGEDKPSENIQQCLEEEREKLIIDITKQVGNGNLESPMNVIMIGTRGVGKSSFINSIAAALSYDRWREHAYTGYHDEDELPITSHIKCFPKCCNDIQYKDTALPQLIDIAGFPNDDTPEWEEVLRLVLHGKLREGDSVSSVYEFAKKFGVDELRSKYSTHEEKLKIHRLVFVGSYTEPVPTDLISMVIRVARPTASHRRVIPLFGVLTKADIAENISAEEVQEKQKHFINALGLCGAKIRFLSCQNYCDALDEKMGFQRNEKFQPQLDISVLRFLRQVCDTVLEVQNEDATYNLQGISNTVQNWLFGLGLLEVFLLMILFLVCPGLLTLFITYIIVRLQTVCIIHYLHVKGIPPFVLDVTKKASDEIVQQINIIKRELQSELRRNF